MESQEEYHDPDYAGTTAQVKEEPPSLSEEEKIEKIRNIVRREFSNELDVRENEIMLIDQRASSSRRALHRLRYALVNSYYQEQRLQLSGAQANDEVEPRARTEVSALLRDGQRRLHPSVRKLLGKQTADLHEILLRCRAPRNKTRPDYSAMLQTRNYTISADATKSLRPADKCDKSLAAEVASTSHNRKEPRHIEPKILNVVTLDQATRNQMKYRYRIIIGNTSKYAPPSSRADRSTHKWLLYVRGPPARPDLSRLVTSVCVRLHHSYAPHHTVHIDKYPFLVSRRGWGEFPAKIELHFPLPGRNRPAVVEHTIKLDRNYTGLQTLGGETHVDVWLYSTPDMLEFEYKEDSEPFPPNTLPKTEPIETTAGDCDRPTDEHPNPAEPQTDSWLDRQTEKHTENWLDFFTNTTELDVDEMFIKDHKPKTEDNKDLENLIETNVISKENNIDDHDATNNVLPDDSLPVKLTDVKIEPDSLPAKLAVVKTEQDSLPVKLADVKIEADSLPVKLTDVKTEHDSWSVNYTEDIPNELLTQPTSPKKRIMKYMDPTTGKIYYLEMDRNLDLSKVQEIVINSKGNVKTAKISPIKPNGLKNVRKTKKGGVSLLKPEIKSLLKNENSQSKKSVVKARNYTHIENDHCYLGTSWSKTINAEEKTVSQEKVDKEIKKEKSAYDCLCSSMDRFSCIRIAVNYLLKKMPIISSEARDPDFVKHFPYVVENEERYWKLDFAKRRNIEWSRAKLINKLLVDHFTNEPIWRTKQILIYSRLHGYYPIRTETIQRQPETETEWSSWIDFDNSRRSESNIRELYPSVKDISTLSVFNMEDFKSSLSDTLELSDDDEEVDIVRTDDKVIVKSEVCQMRSDLTVLPVDSDEDRLRYFFVERMCADIGIELRNEDVGNGYSYSAVHAVILSAVRNFAEELIRSALAARLQETGSATSVWVGSSTSRSTVSLEHVYRGARAPRLRALTAHCLATARKDTCPI